MSSEDENTTPSNSEASATEAKKPARKRAVKKTAAKKTAVKKTAVKKRARKAVAKASESSAAEQPEMFALDSSDAVAPKRGARRNVKKKEFVPAEVLAGEIHSSGERRTPGLVWSSDDEPKPTVAPKVEVKSKAPQPESQPQSEQAPREGAPGGQPSKEGKPNQGHRNEHGRGGHRNQRRGGNDRGERNERSGSNEPNGGNERSGGNERGGGNDRGGHERQNRNSKFKNKNNVPNKKGKSRWQNKKKRSREEESPIDFGALLEFELFERREEILKVAEELRSGSDQVFDFNRIYDMGLPELRAEVAALAVETPNAPNREQLLNALIAHAGESKTAINSVGIFEPLEDEDGGLLVYQHDNYRIKALSAYVPQAFVDHYGLLRGHIVKAQLHPHRENESCPFVVCIPEVMGRDPETLSEIVPFTEGIPYYPLERILMEADSESKWDNLSMRVVDCLTPVGFGQRGLIVAPPRTGKTVLMQGMANSIQKNYPDAHLIILLIDERPEEVTDFRRQVSGEVISSTFDETAESHVHAAEMVIEKARRMVEVGKDVVILLDSITRLARAYNTTMPSSGKILSGGVEANALQKPKRFFGSARNIEGGGSLTIIATALVETGSKMDEVIFEEFKGTGNMELHLDRGLSDKRIFPALSMDKSGTRKEELLYHPDEMLKIYSLRRAMKGLPSIDAMEMLIQRIKKTKTNAEFLMSVSR
jgi:transcription termination factor Rho